MILELEKIIITAIGVLLSLILNDVRTLLFSDIIVKIIDAKIGNYKKIKIFGAEIDTPKILELSITIILSIMLILLILYIF